MPIYGKCDTPEPVFALNLAILEELLVLSMHLLTATNALLGLSNLPHATTGAVCSGTPMPTPLQLGRGH